jgi:hypothetical protein
LSLLPSALLVVPDAGMSGDCSLAGSIAFSEADDAQDWQNVALQAGRREASAITAAEFTDPLREKQCTIFQKIFTPNRRWMSTR